jgi:Cellulase (glycosyl hydrolase family 5)
VRRTAHLALVVCVLALSAVAALVTPAAYAAERMWVGFHDDPSFRWVEDRADRIRSTAQNGSTIMRLLVHWNTTAPTAPASPADPFDAAYRFDDIDEAVRSAQANDLEVMITISGTPRWANRGKTPNVAPTRMADFQAFARAIASRYSGRNDGIPFVRFWSVWNEPNLTTFLKPQFNAKGKSVAPATYARIAAAGFAGIKAGNPLAKVAVGETSARGRDKRVKGVSDSHSPGKFAELVAKANKRLRFDGWAHHPYPFNPNSAPSQVVKWPNVSLASLPRFQKGLSKWFKRKSPQVWITEYGHQTRPQDRFGVPYSTQATYIKRAIDIAKKFTFVPMFIWFVYQDSPGQPWESGLYTTTGTAKAPSPDAVPVEREGCRRPERGLPLRGPHGLPPRLGRGQEVLHGEPRRDADRGDLARAEGVCRGSERRADGSTALRLHASHAARLHGREGREVHRELHPERRERDAGDAHADDPREEVTETV